MIRLLSRYRWWLGFGVVLVIATWLRFYRLPELYIFNFDEEYQATYAWSLIKDFHLIWIGVSASFLDYYLGPYFTYLTAGLLAISRGDPLIGGYFSAGLGVITTGVIGYVGTVLFNRRVGLIASWLYATLPLFVLFDQKYWNVTPVGLWAVLLWYVVVKAIKQPWWWVFYTALVSLMLHFHLSLMPATLIGVWFFIRQQQWRNWRLVISCLIVGLVIYWPLIVFDANHNWSNLLVWQRFGEQLQSTEQTAFNPIVKARGVFDSLGRWWWLQPGNPNADELSFGCTSLSFLERPVIDLESYAKRTYAPIWLSMVSLFLIGLFGWRALRSKTLPVKLLAVQLLLQIGFYLAYPGGSFEYYILGSLVLLSVAFGWLIDQLKGLIKTVAVSLVVLAGLLGIVSVISSSAELSLGPKRELVKRVSDVVGDKPFAIQSEGMCHIYEGWRYLFIVYGQRPVKADTDRHFGWLYPDELANDPVEYDVTLVEDRYPLKFDPAGQTKLTSGGYSAYIKRR